MRLYDKDPLTIDLRLATFSTSGLHQRYEHVQKTSLRKQKHVSAWAWGNKDILSLHFFPLILCNPMLSCWWWLVDKILYSEILIQNFAVDYFGFAMDHNSWLFNIFLRIYQKWCRLVEWWRAKRIPKVICQTFKYIHFSPVLLSLTHCLYCTSYIIGFLYSYIKYSIHNFLFSVSL